MELDDKHYWWSHSLFLHKRRDISKLSTWKWMNKKGIDIHYKYFNSVQWDAFKGNLELFKYLHEQGADIFYNDYYAMRKASEYGHTEIVNYLQKHGNPSLEECERICNLSY